VTASKIQVFLQQSASRYRRQRLPEVYRWSRLRKVRGYGHAISTSRFPTRVERRSPS